MLTKSDLNQISGIVQNVVKREVSGLVTKDEARKFATKQDLKNLVTKDEAKNFATKQDLKGLVTKEDAKNFATKKDIKKLETKLDETIRVFDNEYVTLRRRVDKLEVASAV